MTYHANLRDGLAAIKADWVSLLKSPAWTGTARLEDLQNIVRDLQPQLQDLYKHDKYYGVWALDSVFVDPKGHYHLLPGFALDAQKPLTGGIPISSFTAIEQLTVDSAPAVGERSDVYGLGMLLWVLLFKKVPKRALERVSQREPSLISQFSNLSAAEQQVCKIIDQSTAVLPYERISSIDELNDALRAVVSGSQGAASTTIDHGDDAQAGDLGGSVPQDSDVVASTQANASAGDTQSTDVSAPQNAAGDRSSHSAASYEKHASYTATLSSVEAAAVGYKSGVQSHAHHASQEEGTTVSPETEPTDSQHESKKPLVNETQHPADDEQRSADTADQLPPQKEKSFTWLLVLLAAVVAVLLFFSVKKFLTSGSGGRAAVSQSQQVSGDSGLALTSRDVSLATEESDEAGSDSMQNPQRPTQAQADNQQSSAVGDNASGEQPSGAAQTGSSSDTTSANVLDASPANHNALDQANSTAPSEQNAQQQSDSVAAADNTTDTEAIQADPSSIRAQKARQNASAADAVTAHIESDSGAEASTAASKADSSATDNESATADNKPVSVAQSTAQDRPGKASANISPKNTDKTASGTTTKNSNNQQASTKKTALATPSKGKAASSAVSESGKPKTTAKNDSKKQSEASSSKVIKGAPKPAPIITAMPPKPAQNTSTLPEPVQNNSTLPEPIEEGKQTSQQAKAAKGTIIFRISPWGEYVINGKTRGVTPPNSSVSLAPGTYNIRISNGGVSPEIQRSVRIESGQTETITHQFAVP